MITGAISIILWYKNIWGGGDAKLFTIYSLLLPLTYYQNGFINYFPSITLFINTFVPISLILFISLVFKLNKVHLPNKIEILNYGLTVFGFFWILEILGIGNIITKLAIISILGFFIKNIYILSIVSIVRIFLDKTIFSHDFLIQFSIAFITYTFIRLCFDKLSTVAFEKNIHPNKLKEGMILHNYRIVTKTEIMKLKDEKSVRINKTMNFAIFIFIGVLITIMIKGHILQNII